MSKKSKFLISSIAVFLLSITVLAQVNAAEKVTYFHVDALGSPVAATDENGEVVWREEYTPYGERMNLEPASTNNSRWYAGHQHDDDTGLTYMGARYYDPVIGRFMGMDPVGVDTENIHSFNRYAYANNNPYRFVDTDGRESMGVYSLLESDGDTYSGFGGGEPLSLQRGSAQIIAAIEAIDTATSIVAPAKGIAGLVVKQIGKRVAKGTIPRNKSLSTIRQAGPDETFVRFESADVRFSKVTAQGGLKPG